jgi:hypothetical protein
MPDNLIVSVVDIFTKIVRVEPTATLPKSYSCIEVSASKKFGDSIAIEKMVNRIVKLFVFTILSPNFYIIEMSLISSKVHTKLNVFYYSKYLRLVMIKRKILITQF